METNKPPQEKGEDSLPILPQTAVRQIANFTMPMYMSSTDLEEELTSSSTEDGSSSPNQSGFLPNLSSAIAYLKTEGSNKVEMEGEEDEEELEEKLEEESEEELTEDEVVEVEEQKKTDLTMSSVHDVERERFSTILVVTRNIQLQQNRLFSECARASAR